MTSDLQFACAVLCDAKNEKIYMNVNLSSVSATSKASVSESGAKTSAEGLESKGFLQTLAGVFTDSQKNSASLANPVTQANEVEDSSSVQFMQSQGESQETVTVDGKNKNQSTDALLAKESDQETSDDQVVALVKQDSETESKAEAANNSAEVASTSDSDRDASQAMIIKSDQQHAKSDKADAHDVKRSMDEGQQLLGRIERAQQTLKPHSQDANSGKGLPPEVTDRSHNIGSNLSNDLEYANDAVNFVPAEALKQIVIEPSEHVSESPEWQAKPQTEATVRQTGENVESITQVAGMSREEDSGDVGIDVIQRVSIDELEVIDTKLAQGKALTDQETEIIDGLKTGAVIAELPEEELAQLVALPSDVKVALSESQTAQHNTARQLVISAPTPQVTAQELKHAAGQGPAQTADKAVLPAMPEGLATVAINPAIGQMAVNTEVSHKALNVALAVGSSKATADKQEKTEPQQGLAGQLQAAVNQQGVTTPQQTRAVDAAQQAQLPLQLTKELANDQVAEKVQMMMSKNLKNLDIRLDPPELGRMQIRITMNSDLTNVHFTVTNPQARDIIEQTLPRLREMLAQQGMQLAESSVQQQSSGQQQSGYAAAEQNRQGTVGRGFSSGQSDDNIDADIELNVKVTSPRDGISFYA